MPATDRPRAHPGRRPTLVGLALLAVVAVATAACLPGGTRGSGGAGSVDPGQPAITASPAPTGPTPRPPIVPPTPTPAPTFLVHVVAKGESLNTIAHEFGTSARSIAFWNRSTYPSLDPESAGYRPGLLQVGWTLFLIPNVILTDDEAPPLPTTEVTGPSDEPAASDGSEP